MAAELLPDMCVHLCPALEPGAADAFGVGLAAWDEVLPETAVDEVVDDACDARAPDVELVEALAMVSPNASVAPSKAAPAAVPTRGLAILTRFSFRLATCRTWFARARGGCMSRRSQ
jgi:hypothetical protein